MLQSTINLNFKSTDLAAHAPDLISKRHCFHLKQESIVYQTRWMIEKLILTRKLANQHRHLSGPTVDNSMKTIKSLDTEIKVGIVLYDLFPETSESLCWSLLDHLSFDNLLQNDQLEIISRRTDFQNHAPVQFKGIKVSWNFHDPNYIQSFDLIVICGTSMNVPMLKELFCNQDMYQTIALMTIPGILINRIQSILGSELVVLCNFTVDDTILQNTQQNVFNCK